MFCPNFVDHLVFRVAEMDRTERFYSALLGEPLKEEDYIMYMAGDTRLFFTCSAESRQGTFHKENVGLNHMAWSAHLNGAGKHWCTAGWRRNVS